MGVIALFGAGEMGEALLAGLVRSGHEPAGILVVEPRAEHAQRLRETYGITTAPARAYAALLSIMRNAAQPFGTRDPARPNISMTIWRTLADLTSRVYAFESSFSPDIVWTRLDRVDFGGAARLDLVADNLVVDVTGRYEPRGPFTFALAGA